MGFIDKLFGGKKGENFTDTTDTMPDYQFWKIIEVSYKDAKGDYEVQQEMLATNLRKINTSLCTKSIPKT